MIEKHLNDKIKSDPTVLERKCELICHIIDETMQDVPQLLLSCDWFNDLQSNGKIGRELSICRICLSVFRMLRLYLNDAASRRIFNHGRGKRTYHRTQRGMFCKKPAAESQDDESDVVEDNDTNDDESSDGETMESVLDLLRLQQQRKKRRRESERQVSKRTRVGASGVRGESGQLLQLE